MECLRRVKRERKEEKENHFFEEGVVIIDASQGGMDKNLTQKSCTI